MKSSRIVLGCILASLGFLAGGACAQFLAGGAGAQVITEFSAGISAGAAGITAGPDGNLWFTEPSIDRIGRITPQGVVTEFSAGITAGARPYDITAGPDGNLWFTEPGVGQIGRITPAGVVTEFSSGTSAPVRLNGITAGSDGNLWFVASRLCLYHCFGPGSSIGRITPLGVVTQFRAGAVPSGITAGPDGNLWFKDELGFGGRIGRITPLGVVTEFGGGAGLFESHPGITSGPDGNLWFTRRPPASNGSGGSRIGRIDPLTGTVTQFSVGLSANADPTGITGGPDGNVWFTECNGNRVGRITPLGVVTEFSAGITAGACPYGITAGPDGNLWFTEGSGRIGRITLCCNTPVGSDVDVVFDGGASPAGDVSVTFTQVTVAGDTVLSISGSCPTVPSGFSLGTPAVCYDLTTTAVFIPPAEVCIDYSGSSFASGPIALLHYEGGTWVDVTTSVDTTNEVVCGDVDSFSPFVVAVKVASLSLSTTTLVSSANPAQLGRPVVFTASVVGNFPTGTVQFMDGETPLGSPVTLSAEGVAQVITSTLTWGTHAITAVYSGDAYNAASTSSVLFEWELEHR